MNELDSVIHLHTVHGVVPFWINLPPSFSVLLLFSYKKKKMYYILPQIQKELIFYGASTKTHMNVIMKPTKKILPILKFLKNKFTELKHYIRH